jgi:hypothetical protein
MVHSVKGDSYLLYFTSLKRIKASLNSWQDRTGKNSVALVRKRTMLTERPPLVGEVVPTFADRGCRVVSATDPPVVSLGRTEPVESLSPKYIPL